MSKIYNTIERIEKSKVFERFFDKVQKTDSCWLWTGTKTVYGYASFFLKVNNGRNYYRAHRFSYEFLVGKIPEGKQLDHLCRVRHCVNPDHLEPVTARENLLRGVSPSAINAKRKFCINGHKFNEKNTYYRPRPSGRMTRQCKRCSRINSISFIKRKAFK